MGVLDLLTDAGVSSLDSFLASRSYIVGHEPTQADIAVHKALTKAPEAKYVNASRWYKHITSYLEEADTLPGDASKPYSSYGIEVVEGTPAAKPAAAAEEDDDDEVDLFGSDDEEEDAAKAELTRKRLEEYNAKKAAKGPKPAAKSIVTLDVKPWDDETDMKQLEANVRAIEKDGLVWGASTLIAVGYGIKKLQINLVVEDEKISLDELQQEIEGDEDHVQSTDVAAMQKL